jgi:hypothetical protein
MLLGIFRIAFVLILLAAPAWAEAHPGLHWNPHVPSLVLYAALGFLIVAWISMAVFLLIQRTRRRRLISKRLRHIPGLMIIDEVERDLPEVANRESHLALARLRAEKQASWDRFCRRR